jgi:hypothetical protein
MRFILTIFKEVFDRVHVKKWDDRVCNLTE